MNQPITMTLEFLKAAAKQLDERPSVPISQSTFEEIFAPIKELMKQDPAFDNHEVTTSDQIKLVRQIVLEANVTDADDDLNLAERHTNLINTLQETLEEIGDTTQEVVLIDFETLHQLTDLKDGLHDAAATHRRFLKRPECANALDQVSLNIRQAQLNLWEPQGKQVERIAAHG